MATRNTFNGSSTDVPWVNTMAVPEGFGDQYARMIDTLMDAATFPLTAVGGTADVVTATLDPVLAAGLVDGMKFGITWAATNTGPMTLAINGGSAIDILGVDGSVMGAAAAVSGTRALLEYISGDFRVISGTETATNADPYYTAITASGTWNKPTGYADDAQILVEAWGGGGGGAGGDSADRSGGGGGGGGYAVRRMRYADVTSTVTCTIGTGGAAGGAFSDGSAGVATTFGSYLTAYAGGGGGYSGGGSTGGGGGAGAGMSANGASTTSNTGALSTDGGDSGGNGGTSAAGAAALGGFHEFSGGGGGGAGGGGSQFGGAGGRGYKGGGGGAGGSTRAEIPAGGASRHGGAGGAGGSDTSNPGVAGSAPGGGGGGAGGGVAVAGGAGARGEIRIWIIG